MPATKIYYMNNVTKSLLRLKDGITKLIPKIKILFKSLMDCIKVVNLFDKLRENEIVLEIFKLFWA